MKPLGRTIASIAVAALLAAPAGCGGGGGGSDPSQVRAAVVDFVRAVNQKDAGTACPLLSSARLKLIHAASGGKSCKAALGEIFASTPGRTKVTIQGIRISGDRATVDVTFKRSGSSPQGQSILLEKQNGAWKISDANF